MTSGNHASEQTLTGTQTKGSYYFLTNVDVQNAAAWGAVVTLGASITDGVCLIVEQQPSLAERFGQAPRGRQAAGRRAKSRHFWQSAAGRRQW